MQAAGATAVLTNCADKPGSAWVSAVSTASARLALPASITSRRSAGAIHTLTVARLVKAIGSRSSRAWSFSSLRCFLPGLRPVCFSTWAASASTWRLTTEPGTTFCSTISCSSHWPAMASIKMPCSSPRGETQPIDTGWVAPHSAKRVASSASSIWATVADQSGARR